jgi:hypothetical protein
VRGAALYLHVERGDGESTRGERIFCVAYRSENTLFRHGTGWSNGDSVVRNRAHVGAAMPWLYPPDGGLQFYRNVEISQMERAETHSRICQFLARSDGDRDVLRQLAEEMFLFDGDQIA